MLNPGVRKQECRVQLILLPIQPTIPGTGYSESTLISQMDGWAEDFYVLLDDQMKSTITSFISYYDLIKWNATLGFWEVIGNIGVGSGNVTLTNLTDVLPFQCAPCLVGFTTKPKSRGRKFLPLFCEDQQAASNLVAAATTALAAALTEYLSDFVLATGHSVAPGVASNKWEIFLPFVSGLVANNIFTQRRRTKGRGI